MLMPSAGNNISTVARWPEPGLPTLKRLPLKSSIRVTLASLRARTVSGSACRANTARKSPKGPTSLNCAAPFTALYCTSDCTTPKSSSSALIVFTL